MNSDVQKYKDMEKRLTLMHDKAWLQTIDEIKKFVYDDNFRYSVTYKQDRQRNNRNFTFQDVSFVEETNTFIFTSFSYHWETGELEKDKVSDRLTLKDIEIIKVNKNEVEDYSDLNGFI
ncbi:hypothetical protein [Neobacillus vireti]|uniref:Uncharacterized protein n=1 Tax=Neobacillus vireti LMG 21834 TaxID=1131730 RepID=A0AB94IM97_9BACI|nr:hypothetical protein [Neobacillus vireti]ETI68140.1 hypothetical protein BAVI_14094 [Neobacillus vireti LMG 21834]KLT15901.1 hypothetical protein AA980_22165 [Neobacillus vireti]